MVASTRQKASVRKGDVKGRRSLRSRRGFEIDFRKLGAAGPMGIWVAEFDSNPADLFDGFFLSKYQLGC
jgi:hypothetical protein